MKTTSAEAKLALLVGTTLGAGLAVFARLIGHPRTDRVRKVFDRAPWDDEPLTLEEAAEIDAGLADTETIPWEAVRAEAKLAHPA